MRKFWTFCILLCLVLSSSLVNADDLCDTTAPRDTLTEIRENRRLFPTNDCTSDTRSNIELDETIILDVPEFDGTITFSYPQDWAFRNENGSILLANSEEVLAIEDATETTLPRGSILMSVTTIPEDLVGFLVDDSEEVTPKAIIETFSMFMDGEDMPEFDTILTFEIDGHSAASITGSDDNIAATMYAIHKDDHFVFGFGATRADEYGRFEDLFQAIIVSATFTATE